MKFDEVYFGKYLSHRVILLLVMLLKVHIKYDLLKSIKDGDIKRWRHRRKISDVSEMDTFSICSAAY